MFRHFDGRDRNEPGLEVVLILLCLEVHQAGEEKNHIASLIHDRTVAVRAADFAWELVLDALVGWVVPLEIVMAVGEVDVLLVEDGCPLEGSGWESMLVVCYRKWTRVLDRSYHVESGR
jgi:hypothetical protein